MAGSYSHNALSAKARAKFGKRLTLQNFNELLACQSVGEAALYLKNRTYFGPFLSEVRSVDVHRGRLEELLRRKSFEDYSSLVRYSNTRDGSFSTKSLCSEAKFSRFSIVSGF